MNRRKTIILILSFILVAAGIITVYHLAPVYVEKKLKQLVSRQSGGFYTLNLENFRLNIFTGNSQLDAIRLTADTLGASGNDIQHAVFFETKQVVLNNMGFWKLIFHRNLTMSELRINNPKITIVNFSVINLDSIALYPELFSENFESLYFDSLKVHQCQLRYVIHGDTAPSFEVGDIELMVSGWSASLEAKDSVSSHDFQTLKMETGKIISRTGGMYELSVKSFQANSVTSYVRLDSLRLTPLYGKFEHGKMAGHQTDRVTVINKAVHFENVDIKKLILNNSYYAGKVMVEPSRVDVFRDKNLPVAPSRYQPMPQEQLLELPFALKIDSLIFQDSYVKYHEIPGDKISFSHLNLNVINLSNHPDDTVRINGNAMLMGKGRLKAELVFPLADPSCTFTYRGSLGKMSFSTVNSLLESYLGMRASSGVAEKLFFNVRADKRTARGEMEFYYQDFRVELIRTNQEKERKFQRKLGAFLLNSLVIKQSNPDYKGRFRTAHIQYDRMKEKYIFNYLWKSMLDGLKQSTGLYMNNGKLEKRVITRE